MEVINSSVLYVAGYALFFFKDMYLIMNGMNLGKKVKAKASQI